MPANRHNPDQWKSDVRLSVDFYNRWFMEFAPNAYRERRETVSKRIAEALLQTKDLRDIAPALLREHPAVLSMLRMATAPPIAQDRLSGLAGVSRNLIANMEEKFRIPPRMTSASLDESLSRIGQVIERMADRDIFVWLEAKREPTDEERYRAATIVADRLLRSEADPIIRNAQEKRQLHALKTWLEAHDYHENEQGIRPKYNEMQPGTFTFRLQVVAQKEDGSNVNMPMDAVIMPLTASIGQTPLLIEAKSAGDFANTNKRRKEEATKVTQLRRVLGEEVSFVLLLCGYFDSGYLGYEAAERIDWVWEHRLDDLAQLLT